MRPWRAHAAVRCLPAAISERDALAFALALGLGGLGVLALLVNALTAALTFLSLIGYAVIYTVYLKRATPQNIVIGGAAGAAPPVLGWTAVTNEVSGYALLLFLIIFTWTPPHFWALAIARRRDYEKAEIPMFPVAYGEEMTKSFVIYYTILLVVVTLLPYLTGMSGLLYLLGALAAWRRLPRVRDSAEARAAPGYRDAHVRLFDHLLDGAV
jgi:heme o synthase